MPNNEPVKLKYVHLHNASNAFFVPGFGNVKAKFEVTPQDQSGLKAEALFLMSNQMVSITIKGKEGLVTFWTAVTNCDVVLPA